MSGNLSNTGSRLRWVLQLLLIYLVAVGVRAAFLRQVCHDSVYVSLGHDELVNDQVARAILSGQMPQSSFYKAPLYMYVLAGFYRLLGEDPLRARWAQLFVDGLSPVLLALISRRLFGGGVGLFAGLVGALFWSFVFYATELVDTSLACLLYLLLAYLMVALPEGRWWKWLICGLVLGAGIITRPNIQAFAPVLAVVVFVLALRGGQGLRVALGHVLALAVGCSAAIMPVTLHNVLVGRECVLVATYGGLNAYAANSPWSDGKNGPLLVGEGVPDISSLDPTHLWSRLDLNYNIARTYAQKQLGRPLTMAEVDQFFYRHTRQYILSHPGKFLTDSFKRFCWFFNAYEFPNLKDPYRLNGASSVFSGLSWLHFGLMCPAAILGLVMVLTDRRWTEGRVCYLAMLGALFVPGLFFVMNSRYRMPTVYVLTPLAAYGVIRFVQMWTRPTRWSVRIGGCALLGGMAVFSNANLFGYSSSDHTELLMTYAQGAFQTGRRDLLADAAARFEKAYWHEVEHGGRPWIGVLYHCRPLTWLFAYSHALNDRERMKKYGRLSAEQEDISQVAFTTYRILVQEGLREEATLLLDRMGKAEGPDIPRMVAEASTMHFEKFKDRQVLLRTERQMSRMLTRHPEDAELRESLAKVRQLLELTENEARSVPKPLTTTTRATQP